MNNGIYENIIILLCLLALAGALAGVIAALKKEMKESMYSYKGARLLGGAVYLVFMLGVSLRSVFSGPGLDETYSDHESTRSHYGTVPRCRIGACDLRPGLHLFQCYNENI